MRLLVDEALAMNQLTSMCQADVSPVLTSDEVLQCLDDSRQAFIWTASTNYAADPLSLGVVVLPTGAKRNGHRYRLTAFDGTGSTSAATEPEWPTSHKSKVTDGNVTWTEDGPDFQQLWDLNDAACRAWLLKASKVAQCTDFSQDGVSFSSSQMYAHCIEQSLKYVSVTVA